MKWFRQRNWGIGADRVKAAKSWRGNGRVRVTGRGELRKLKGGCAAGRAARRDKEEIIQSISPGHNAIIRSHLFSRAILLFIELLSLTQGDCNGRTLTPAMPHVLAVTSVDYRK